MTTRRRNTFPIALGRVLFAFSGMGSNVAATTSGVEDDGRDAAVRRRTRLVRAERPDTPASGVMIRPWSRV